MTARDMVFHYHDRIALEAGVFNNVTNIVKEAIPFYIGKIKEVSSIINFNQEYIGVAQFFSKESRVLSKTRNMDILNDGAVLVQIPEDFKGHYLEYAEDLHQCLQLILNRSNVLLTEVNTYLSAIITNVDSQLSLKSTSLHEVRKEIDSINKTLSSYFPKPIGRNRAEIRDVLERYNDIKLIKSKVGDIDKLISKLNLKNIEAKIKETIDLSELVHSRLESGHIQKLSPMVSKTLSEHLLVCGLYIELISVVYNDTIIFINMVDKLFDTILNPEAMVKA